MYDAWDEQEKHDRRGGKYDLISLHMIKRHQARVHIHRGQTKEESFATVEVLDGLDWKLLHKMLVPQIGEASAYTLDTNVLHSTAGRDRDILVKVAETLLVGRVSTGREELDDDHT